MSRDDKSRRKPWEEREASRAWGVLLFGLIGATATCAAVYQLRRTVDWIYTQLSRSQSSSSWRNASNSSNRGGFREEAWSKYQRRMQEEHEEEMERVERIRRMQSVFNRERNKFKKSYERWRENDFNAYQQAYQHIPRDDWYYKTDTSYREQRTNYQSGFRHTGSYTMSHHYSILGLDRMRAQPYSDEEIKKAFRAKAMEYHPDQNQDNKEAAEAKFKEVMNSYEAIKIEKKNGRPSS